MLKILLSSSSLNHNDYCFKTCSVILSFLDLLFILRLKKSVFCCHKNCPHSIHTFSLFDFEQTFWWCHLYLITVLVFLEVLGCIPQNWFAQSDFNVKRFEVRFSAQWCPFECICFGINKCSIYLSITNFEGNSQEKSNQILKTFLSCCVVFVSLLIFYDIDKKAS